MNSVSVARRRYAFDAANRPPTRTMASAQSANPVGWIDSLDSRNRREQTLNGNYLPFLERFSMNSATRVLSRCFGENLHRSDVTEAAAVALLQCLDVNNTVADDPYPTNAVLAWVGDNLDESAFTIALGGLLNSAATAERRGN
jgi:hypothetical protein